MLQSPLKALRKTTSRYQDPANQWSKPFDFGLKESTETAAPPAPGRPRLGGASLYDEDPSVERYLGDSAIRDELRVKKANSAGFGGSDYDRFSELLGIYDDKIEENPLTAQGERTDNVNELMSNANLEGFGGQEGPFGESQNPLTTKAQYGRAIDQQKLHQPLDIANIQAGTARDVAQIGASGAMGVEQIKRDQMDRNQERFQHAIDQLGGAGGDIDSITLPGQYGGGTINRMNPTSGGNINTLLNGLTNARRRHVEEMKNRPYDWQKNWFGAHDPSIETRATLDQQIYGIMDRYPNAPPSSKSLVAEIMSEPAFDNFTFEQILENQPDLIGPETSQEEVEAARSLLRLFRQGHQ